LQAEPGGGQRRGVRRHGPLQRDHAGVEVPPEVDANNSANGPRFYVFGSNNRPLANGQAFDSEREAREAVGEDQRRSAKVLEFPRASSCCATRRVPPTPTGSSRPIPTAGGCCATICAQRHGHPQPGAELRSAVGNEPIVTFDFTDRGRERSRTRRARSPSGGRTTPRRV
jgi:hypothetical protein